MVTDLVTIVICDLAPVKGSRYREPDYAPSATRHLELQPRACGTVCRPLSLQPAHSRLSKDNWNLFFSRTHFPSFSLILIAYRVLEAFSLNAMLIFTFNNNNRYSADDCLRYVLGPRHAAVSGSKPIVWHSQFCCTSITCFLVFNLSFGFLMNKRVRKMYAVGKCTARRQSAVFNKPTVRNVVTVNTAVFFWQRYSAPL